MMQAYDQYEGAPQKRKIGRDLQLPASNFWLIPIENAVHYMGAGKFKFIIAKSLTS